MTHDQFEVLSNQAVAACAVVYFLAVLAHLAAVGRRPQGRGRRSPSRSSVGGGDAGSRRLAGAEAAPRSPSGCSCSAASASR